MLRPAALLVLVAAAFLLISARPAEHALAASSFFVVTDTGDAPDANTADGVCATAGTVCTLRAAIQQANANGNPAEIDTIAFSNGGSGVVMNIRPMTPLPPIAQPVILAGHNASGSSCDPPRTLLVSIEPGAAMPGGIGLEVTASSGVSISGLQVGGFATAGVQFTSGSGHTIYCSNIGTNLAGTAARANGIGVAVVGATSTGVGFSSLALSNVISGNGVGVAIDDSTSTTVQGSYIGLAADGATPLPNQSHGIWLRNSTTSSLGKDTATGGNVISGNGGNGILVEANGGTVTSVIIEHNLIGYAADGSTLRPNAANGISVHAGNAGVVTTVRIGELQINDANKVYASGFNSAVLVRELDEASDISKVKPTGNSLISESGLAFNLRPFDEAAGVITPNDGPALDSDAGPNTLLNFPVLATATSEQFPKFQFAYRTAANISISLHFYAVSACSQDPANRSMERWLGSTAYTTDANGFVAATSTGVSSPVAVGDGVVAVAQDELGNTSEISNCVTATLPPPEPGLGNVRYAIAGQIAFVFELESFYGPFEAGAKITWAGQDLITSRQNDYLLSALISAELVGDTARIVQVGATNAGTVSFPVIRSSSDVECSGTVTAADALLLMNYLAGITAGSGMAACDLPPYPLGDANQNEATDLADVLHVRRELVDLDQPLPGVLLDDD